MKITYVNYKRFTAVEKSIKDIKPDEDVKVRLTGVVVSKDSNVFVLDDGTASVQVFADGMDIESVCQNQQVSVFGRVSPNADSFDIQAEAVQQMNGLDMELYKKASLLWNKRIKEVS